MPTLTVPGPHTLIRDIDAVDQEFWRTIEHYNKSRRNPAVRPSTGPEIITIPLTHTRDTVASIVEAPSTSHNVLRAAAWHPFTLHDWVLALGASAPSPQVCNLVHAALGNASLEWDVLRELHAAHRHPEDMEGVYDPVRRTWLDACTPVSRARAVLQNRAAPPDLVSEAIRVLAATPWWVPEGHPEMVFRDVVVHANATTEDITMFTGTLLNTVISATDRRAQPIADLLEALIVSGGYTFGEFREFNAGGRIGNLNRWQSLRIVDAATW